MGLLKSVENTIANLIEGTFGRVFRSEVRPMELARKLAREMDAHRTHSISHVYVPNEYSVWLSPADRARYAGIEHEVIEELCAYLLEHARREDLVLSSPPRVSFHTDERLALGEFGIQARLVRPEDHSAQRALPGVAAAAGPAAVHAPLAAPQADEERGHTMIYSGAERLREHLGAPAPAGPARAPRALLALGERRMPLPPQGGVVGRSRDCAVVLEDSGVSRRHAELRPAAEGWTITDLGSTNGVLVNGRAVRGSHVVHGGDRIELGSTQLVFELE